MRSQKGLVLGQPEEIAQSTAPVIKPWKRVILDPEYGGCWSVAGDLTGDGAPEIVSAQNYNENDIHYTSAVVAQRLDGSVLWRWGDPKIGRKKLHHDVACQIYDWNGDGHNEVVLCTDGYLVHLDGGTGEEIRRLPLPKEATDCVAFVNLAGAEHAGDVLVKTRYTQVWAYSYSWDLRWSVEMPGGYRTAHQPVPIDLDGDGRDEIMAGYALLNPDGSVRWVYESEAVDLKRGHLDAMRVFRAGERPEDYRLVLTCCGAGNLAMVDGTGRPVWESSGYHFESIDIGKFCPDVDGLQIAVDIDHVPWAQSPVWVFDQDGNKVSEILTVYSRSHHLIDWYGNGVQSLVIARPLGLFDCQGRREAMFSLRLPDGTEDLDGVHLGIGDMTGNGVPDIVLNSERAVYILENPGGAVTCAETGTGTNFTYY